MAVMHVEQSVEGPGKEQIHTHAGLVHSHDHYHVALVHDGIGASGWKHETTWHTHEHNHNATTHSHDFPRREEEDKHGKRAHIHDHGSPMSSPA